MSALPEDPASDDLPIVDAHQHFWDLDLRRHPWLCGAPIAFRYGDYAGLRRSYLPPDYRRDAARHSVVKTVHMEAEWDPTDPLGETRWLLEIARRWGIPNAAVGQAWLDRPDAGAVLAAQAATGFVRAIRHKPRAAPSPDAVRAGARSAMVEPAWRAGYAQLARHGLGFELQTPYWHLPEAAVLARDFPETPIVINHAGMPSDRSAAGLAAWRDALAQVAAQPNVALKLSGIGIRDRPWTIADNGPVVLDAIAIFGVDRCMFASNFPVDGLVATLDQIWRGFKTIVRHLPRADRLKLFHDNAVRFYRL